MAGGDEAGDGGVLGDGAGWLCAGVVGVDGDAGWLCAGACGAVGVGTGSGGFGFVAPECRSTGGPVSSSSPRGMGDEGFLVALAASDSAVCHVPSAIHSLVCWFCNAPPTVKRPCETPVRSASYSVAAQSAMGTGDAL